MRDTCFRSEPRTAGRSSGTSVSSQVQDDASRGFSNADIGPPILSRLITPDFGARLRPGKKSSRWTHQAHAR
eukprot:scaffold10267_cov116-Isochrysis_galbana.AAC.4